jgi:hypothetical protein
MNQAPGNNVERALQRNGRERHAVNETVIRDLPEPGE